MANGFWICAEIGHMEGYGELMRDAIDDVLDRYERKVSREEESS